MKTIPGTSMEAFTLQVKGDGVKVCTYHTGGGAWSDYKIVDRQEIVDIVRKHLGLEG